MAQIDPRRSVTGCKEREDVGSSAALNAFEVVVDEMAMTTTRLRFLRRLV
jgi:hypothetical protein